MNAPGRPKRAAAPAPRPSPSRSGPGEEVPATSTEAGRRTHGDSYSETSREEDLIGTASSHAPRADRRTEEPSEAVPDPSERLEGNL